MPTQMVHAYDKRTGRKLVDPVPDYFLDMFQDTLARTPQGAASATRALAAREATETAQDQGTETQPEAEADSPAETDEEN